MMVDHTSHAGDPLGSHLLGGKTSWGGPMLTHLRHRFLQEVHGPKDVDGILVVRSVETFLSFEVDVQ